MPTATALKSKQIGVPFTDEEWRRLNEYLAKNNGMKKGLFIRNLVLRALREEEQE